jgi:hypothetical protein
MNRYLKAFHKLVSNLDAISAKYAKSKIWFLIDALYGYIRYGITPNEYVGFEFYKKSNIERKRYFTNRDQHKYESRFNDPKASDSFDRKEITNQVFSKYVKRDWLYTGDASVSEIKAFIDSHEKVIVKPVGMSSGRGIFSLSKAKGEGFEEFKQRLDVNVETSSELKDVLIEEFVNQHPKLKECNPSSVNTIRVFTVADRNQNLTILSTCLRVGGANADVDNYHAGGVAYPIDSETGIVFGAGYNIDGRKFTVHPSTGKLMLGFQIPNWNRLLEVIADLATIEPRGRMIAWDLAETPDGFELIEANYRPGLIIMQQGGGEGLKPLILKHL